MIRTKNKQLQRFPAESQAVIPSLSPPSHVLHSDPLLHKGTRGPPGDHPFSSAQTVRPANSQGLLGPYPLLQHAVTMPRQPGGGRSLLGAAPFRVPLRTPRMAFLPEHLHESQGAFINKKGCLHNLQRKRQNEQRERFKEKSNGQMSKYTTEVKTSKEGKKLKSSVETQDSSSEQKDHGAAEMVEESEDIGSEQKSADSSTMQEQEVHAYAEEECPEADKEMEQSRTAEVLGVGTSLKVTIQHSSESRAFSTRSEEAAGAAGLALEKDMSMTDKYCCYICNVTSPDQHDFQTHMISLGHQQKMREIQHLSNTCLATLLPKMHQSLQGKYRQGLGIDLFRFITSAGQTAMGNLQRWCTICQCHFTGDLIKHRRTKKHKMAKVSSRPVCTVCERHFRTPRKFVEHMKSSEHKQQVEELKEDGGPEVMGELITLDAIGCFEDEDEYEEDGEEEEETVSEQVNAAEITDDKEYDPDTQYGTSFVIPVAGFLCKLCHKFYHFESRARETHCKSLTHYQNLQKYKVMLNLPQEDDETPDSFLVNIENVENSSGCTAETKFNVCLSCSSEGWMTLLSGTMINPEPHVCEGGQTDNTVIVHTKYPVSITRKASSIKGFHRATGNHASAEEVR
ncbi:cdkn1a interacting zinc finger protein 1b isoform X3 [Tachysurus fulvidraco]|uniref:cdkn1a interacting zinc finger protein 1b isoform X3 n=1 Tax=Tachysurus fulvidraco TaxID=1234273 RepID=UPI001FEFAC68|nr:cdkn1a interacting zinc finger protein 1b isoform X3 [Tachysurus fulvidraco]